MDQSYKLKKDYLLMKADQHWDMAGLARQDGDTRDEEKHTKLAREYQEKARNAQE